MAENSRNQPEDPNQKNVVFKYEMEGETADDLQLGPTELCLHVIDSQATPKTDAVATTSRMFIDDEVLDTPHHRVSSTRKRRLSASPKKVCSPSSAVALMSRKKKRKVVVKREASSAEEENGLRLSNLLKMPMAQKWVYYEWFLSNIDRCIFTGDNEFQICLKNCFPSLKTRKLTRVQWTIVRRMLGKPRRCSDAFFREERLELDKKRNMIRALQQGRKVTDVLTYSDLPPEIPVQLAVGTKVTARLRKPLDGLFTGSVDAVDISNNTYRITFGRFGLGTHSVPDYEVLSNDAMNTMLTYRNSSPVQYPPALLKHIVDVDKILVAKKRKINLLKTMNTEAERLKSVEEVITKLFKLRYCGILMDLEILNKDLQEHLDGMQTHCHDLSRESRVFAMLTPSQLVEQARQSASDMVNGILQCDENMPDRHDSDDITELITSLTTLMLEIKRLSEGKHNLYELQALVDTMEIMKQQMSDEMKIAFQMMVNCHIQHIQESLPVSIDRLTK